MIGRPGRAILAPYARVIVRALCIASATLALGLAARAACAADSPAPIRVATSNTSSDVGIYIAQQEGYFKQEGIDVTLSAFDSGAQMIAPLGEGQLDVGSGSATAGLYNAVGRGIGIRIVSGNGDAPPGYGHNILLVRSDLIKSGRFKTLSDLKGMKIAVTAPGASSTSTLNEALKKVGLTYADIDPVYLGYPDHVVALANGKVDAALTAEPAATQAIRDGSAVPIMSDDVIDPYHEASDLLYSSHFIQDNPEGGKRFMVAFIRAQRFYNGALKDGRLGGPNADEVIRILTKSTSIKDPAVYRSIAPQGADPDGRLNMASLRKDFAFYKSQGWIQTKVTVDQAVDPSFAEAAVKKLGPYKPK